MASDSLRQSELLKGAGQILDIRRGAMLLFVGLDGAKVLTHLFVVDPGGRQV